MARQPRVLRDKVVAITGGARGLGRATAQALIAEGARVALGDIDADTARETAQELGGGTIALRVDVTDRESFSGFLDGIEAQLGPVDVLINNAGIMPIGPFLEEADSTTRRQIDINLHGVILGCKLGIPRMIHQGGGHIVNISSAAGKVGLAGEAVYCANKHAVVGLTESLRAEFRGTPVDFSLVMPSLANTELASGMQAPKLVPLLEPEDVAQKIVAELKVPKFEVFVPGSLKITMRFQAILPRRVGEWVSRRFETDRIGLRVDAERRAAYIARTTAPTPPPVEAAEQRPAVGAGDDR